MVKDTLNNMSTIAKENLDERIERIKKRNEEIEKKHREAEEDRLRALKENAMVEIKPPKDDDWPRTHKYDKIDFTYDVKPEKLEESNIQKLTDEKKPKRDYKKFAEGEGPPPDPAYNFLADAERDGLLLQKLEKGKEKDAKQNNNNNNAVNNRNKDPQNRRGGPNAGSFRGRGGKTGQNPKYQKQNSQPEYEQWRSEREKIDEARINRQKVGEGKWRREWDNDKLNSENEALLRPERVTLGEAIVAAKKSPNSHHANVMEKRGNITVSVSQTGEVKSVKLTSAPVIGTGRVGPRQVAKPQFSIQAVEKDMNAMKAPHSPKPQHKAAPHRQNTNPNFSSQPNKNIIRRDTVPTLANVNPFTGSVVAATIPAPSHAMKNAKPYKPKSPNFPKANGAAIPMPSTLSAAAVPFLADLPPDSVSELIALDFSHKPEFAKKSVQDRLMRVRQVSQTNDAAGSAQTAPASADSTPAPTSSGDNQEASIESTEPVAVETAERNETVAATIETSADVPVEEKRETIVTAETKEETAEVSDKVENSADSTSETKIESNTISCDSNTTTTKIETTEVSEDQKVNCDTNSNNIVPIAAAADAIAAN